MKIEILAAILTLIGTLVSTGLSTSFNYLIFKAKYKKDKEVRNAEKAEIVYKKVLSYLGILNELNLVLKVYSMNPDSKNYDEVMKIRNIEKDLFNDYFADSKIVLSESDQKELYKITSNFDSGKLDLSSAKQKTYDLFKKYFKEIDG